MNKNELKSVIDYQKQSLYYLQKWIKEEVEKETEKALNETKDILGIKDHVCNFCDSTDTTEYSAEGEGSVWLCEDCRNIGSGDSADR